VSPRVGVVGHVEWVEFAVVDRLPEPGAIVHAREFFQAAAGGGAVAAVQLCRLAGEADFLTVLGDDDAGRSAAQELRGHPGLRLHCATRPEPQRRAFTYLDGAGERTITILGPRLVPSAAGDDLPWDGLGDLDGIYFTGGDPEALRAARAARVLVATPRALATIREAGVELDVLVASATDPGEQVAAEELDPPPRHVVLTRGAEGGTWTGADGATGAWASEPLPGAVIDSYGCGDSFAAGLTYGLAAGLGMDDALRLAARCGAHCLTGRGPYGAQLVL
jgi:ribokinase